MAIAVIAVGTFALPGTVSLFSGQHTWYDLSGRGNGVPCEKCHADIEAEMNAGIGPHTGETGYERMKCEHCHRVFPIAHKNASFETYTYAYADGVTTVEPGREAHAASTVACMYCHSGNKSETISGGKHDEESDCISCHTEGGLMGLVPPSIEYVHDDAKFFTNEDCYKCHLYNDGSIVTIQVPPAGGFNLTIDPADTGEMAAHKTFVRNAINNTQMEDANEACIACHTHAAVNITWVHAHNLEFTATWTDDLQWNGAEEFPPTHFNVSGWTVNGTVTNHSYGNATGAGKTEPWGGW